jgi:hypothetical protein
LFRLPAVTTCRNSCFRPLASLGLVSASVIGFQLALMGYFSNTQWSLFAFMVISVALLGFGASGTCITLFRSWMVGHAQPVIAGAMLFSAFFMIICIRLIQWDPIRLDAMLLFTHFGQWPGLAATYLVLFTPFFFSGLAIGLMLMTNLDRIGTFYFVNLLGSGAGGLGTLFFFQVFSPSHLPMVMGLLPLAGALIYPGTSFKFRVCVQKGSPEPRHAAPASGIRNRPPREAGIRTEIPEGSDSPYAGLPERGAVSIKQACLRYGAILGVLGTAGFFFMNPPALDVSEYKSISRTLQLPDAQVIHEQPTPFGLVQVVSSPVLRYAPGVSLQYRQPVPQVDAVFVNGEWAGPVFDGHSASPGPTSGRVSETVSKPVPNLIPETRPAENDVGSPGKHLHPKENPAPGRHHIYDYTPMALAYRIQPPRTVLCASAGTGSQVSHALSHSPARITALEDNPVIPGLITSLYGSSSVYSHPAVKRVPVDDYTYLLTSGSTYDLIVLPVMDSFGGSSGLYALNEQYLFTRQAFERMWERLSVNGMISVSTWMDYPVRNPLRLLATLVAVLETAGITAVTDHIVSVRSWNMITFVLKKSPVTSRETAVIRDFARKMNFDPVLMPEINPEERMRFNQLQAPEFLSFVDQLMSDSRHSFIRNYEFNIAPAKEDRPYFSQFLKLRHLRHLGTVFTTASLPFLELGYLLLVMTLIQVSVFAVFLIVLPLAVRNRTGSHKGMTGSHRGWTLIYFSALGLGFMFIEMVLIQRFILYFGNPLYAAAAVISAVLTFSGAGSLISSALAASRRTMMACLAGVAAGALLYAGLLTPLLKQTIDLAFPLKMICALVFIAPLSLLMGMPFPLGLRLARQTNPENISWAWSVNGCSSVISVVLATVLAIEFGFVVVMAAAAGMYGTAWAATWLASSE